jgi:hypothetical protein
MKKRSILCLYILFTIISSLYVSSAFAGFATLSWDAPTTNADGTPLTDLAGYKVYYGTSSHTYSQNINIGNVTTYTIDNLTEGVTYYFATTAYDTAGNESEYSNEASKTIQTPQQYTLTINKGGTGAGTVTSSPAGINCGSDCSEIYSSGTLVELTASPNTSSTFAGWSGACSGTGTCTMTMNATKTVTATFNLKTYTITASAGTGGSISPSGSVSVNHGSNKTFTITAYDGYHIVEVLVDGSSVGTINSYTFLNVTANHTIEATFTRDSSPAETIIDNGDPGTSFTGTWNVSEGADPYGTDSLYSRDGATYTWTFTSPQTGVYKLSMWWTYRESRSTNVPVDIEHSEGTTRVYINQQHNGGKWNMIGTYPFESGASYKVTITAQPGPSSTCADAVKLVHVSGGKTLKTGQTESYLPGDDGYIQAGIEWPKPRFTDNGDGTMTDNLTGLMWLKDGGCMKKKKWTDSLNAVTDFNNNPANYNCMEYTATYSDWRLPNVNELASLIHYGDSDSAAWLNSEGFIGVNTSYYWSSTTRQLNPSHAWLIKMSGGKKLADRKAYKYYVLPVRTGTSGNPFGLPKTGQTESYLPGDDGYIQAGIEWPKPRFTDNGDGTMTDNLTGLMWLKDGGCMKKKKWTDSLNAVTDFNNNPANYNCLEYTATYSDWRLPNVNELASLIHYGDSDSAAWLNSEGFIGVNTSYYWSSTTRERNTSRAWSIGKTKGKTISAQKNNRYFIWPVRDKQ